MTSTMDATEKNENDGVYMIINNIPKNFHTCDLRNFFSSFIETGGFICFHFRHRPEVQKPSETLQNVNKEQSRRVTNCCIIKVVSERASEFIKSYNGEHWLDKKGESLMSRCFIKRLIFSENSEIHNEVVGDGECKKGTVSWSLDINQEVFTEKDVSNLIEMHPPTCMPNGNVGTKTSHFLQEIKACRLPPSLISRLGLQFPRNRARRIYGNVPFDYKNKRNNGKNKIGCYNIHSQSVWFKKSEPDTQEESEESESEEEEWDRHEALHDDVTGQERSKERLFEEKIELKWEKGGSGLVFYTDAQFWDAREGDFDAKTTDDWDIDTNIYKNPGMDCDKDSRDLLRMRLEESMRNGTETEIDRLYDFAGFEKYNKGFGRKLMEAQGWKQGLGIGKNCAGIAEPIPNDGQKPTDKKGFGYRGVKLRREPYIKRRRRRSFDSDSSFFISTKYDDPKMSDPPDSVFTSTAYSKLKYRREFLKERGDNV